MSNRRVCDVDGQIIDTELGTGYTVTDIRSGNSKDICYFCARSATKPLAWAATATFSVGDRIHPTLGVGTFVYDVTVPGISGTIEPAWPLAEGVSVIDGTVTYTTNLAPNGNVRINQHLAGSPITLLSLWGWLNDNGETV